MNSPHVPSDDDLPSRAASLRGLVAAVAGACARRPWATIAAALAVAVLSGVFVAHRFAIDSDSTKLISADLGWRQRAALLDRLFPQRADIVAVVVDGESPEVAERAAATLVRGLAARPDLVADVRRPDGGPFFDEHGLLFLDRDELATTLDALVAAQPMLGTLAADPSVRGVLRTLGLAAEGVRRGDTTWAAIEPSLAPLATTLDAVLADRPARLSWRAMMASGDGRAADPRALRRFVLLRPILDFGSIRPGERATDFVRAVARDGRLDAAHGVRVRITGRAPMADEEFGTLEEHAGVNAAAAAIALVAMLWLAVRAWAAVAAIVACLVVGLAVTAAFGLAVFGAFNLISIAFAVLFVGLGVDFGIQYAVAYLDVGADAAGAAAAPRDVVAMHRRAARRVGGALALAAAGIAAGFLAFEPTAYRGVSELGVIAGFGMAVAFAASVTLLPALLVVARVAGRAEGLGFAALAPADRWLAERRRAVLVVAAVATVASVAALPFLRFDADPLHLRSARTEAVATILDLAQSVDTTPDTLDVLAPSLDAARALATRFAALPEVSRALTLASFVPTDQDAKLALIGDTASLIGPTLGPTDVASPPDDGEVVRALRDTARALRDARTPAPASDVPATVRRVADALDALADGPPARRDALRDALVPGLETVLAQTRAVLRARPVSFETLPPALRADWIAADGRARVEVFPKQSSHGPGGDAALARFIASVRSVAPDAGGTPISIDESGRTIVHAFVVAGALALAAVTVLLAVALRTVRDVAVTLASLVFGGLVTLALCVVLGIPLNYANIIALPLLFGIGVAFNIYFVVAWRQGTTALLSTGLARAVVFSAATTATAFGSLWLSSHPGTASMGELLALSLACTLASALLVLPALLGPSPRVRAAT